ncbi:Cid1 [Symbiodinium sp. CCMP2592]|nr:Cid1 [Symbiodinium sp. CCMP2592]
MEEQTKILRANPHPMIPEKPFAKLVKEVLQDIVGPGKAAPKIEADALKILQQATEGHTSQQLLRAGMISLYAGRRTTDGDDMKFVNLLFGVSDSDALKLPRVRRATKTTTKTTKATKATKTSKRR